MGFLPYYYIDFTKNFKNGLFLVMGWVEAIVMPEVRFARRCWVSVAGVEEDIVVVRAGAAYVVGTALDD